jgi:hypothetical protein
MKTSILNHKTILGILVFVLLVIITLSFYKTDTYGSTTLSIAPLKSRNSSLWYFNFVLSTSSKNVVKCENYNPRYSYELNSSCWLELAVLKEDTSYCMNIGDNVENGSANKTNCINYVNKIKTALPEDEIKSCSGWWNKPCFKLIFNDPTLCDSNRLSLDQKNECHIEYSVYSSSTNASQCDSITDSAIKDKCIRYLGLKMVSQKNDVNECNNLLNPVDVNICLRDAAMINNNPPLCEQINGDELATNQCIISSAPAMSDPLICSRLQGNHYGESNKDLCYFQYATINQDTKMCKKISEQSAVDRCLQMISP